MVNKMLDNGWKMFTFPGLAVVVIFYVFINSITTVEQIYGMKRYLSLDGRGHSSFIQ